MSHTRSRKHHPARIVALVAATFSIAASVPNANAADEAIELEEVSVKSKKVVQKMATKPLKRALVKRYKIRMIFLKPLQPLPIN